MSHLTNKIASNNNFFLVNTDDKNNIIFNNKNVIFTDKKNELYDYKSLLNKLNCKFIILDLLHYPDKYIENIKKIFEIKIISFHEYEDYSPYSDLSFNCNLFYKSKPSNIKKLYQGEKFIIFNDEIEYYKNNKRKIIFLLILVDLTLQISH